MTRMWGIDPALLCDKHLLGEHAEMHQVVGTIRNHPHGVAIVRGHADKHQIDTSNIQRRHDELAKEITRRGMDHNSPLKFDDSLQLGDIQLADNIELLKDRCADCRQRIERSESSDDEY